MSKDYTYEVARIRTLELSLLNSAALEQLLAARTYEEALHLLADRGYGDPDLPLTSGDLLAAEERKTWDQVMELTDDVSELKVLKLANDYHNLKAAVKLSYTGAQISPERLFVSGGTLDPSLLLKAIQEREYSLLPEHMAAASAAAYDTLLHTGDGQLCDMILDRAALEAVYEAGEHASDEVLKQYAVSTVVTADIRIAVRCGELGKPLDFILRALAPCRELDTTRLSHAALGGLKGVAEYLEHTDYSTAAEALLTSTAAFERWCSDLVIGQIKPQKSNPFTLGPVAAYVLARENEIKCVRMILSGKQNGLPEQVIRERLGEMYV